MATYKRKEDFFTTEEGIKFLKALHEMSLDTTYITEEGYSSNSERYPGNRISFVNKHMDYLVKHPTTNPAHYLSNLRLMTRVR